MSFFIILRTYLKRSLPGPPSFLGRGFSERNFWLILYFGILLSEFDTGVSEYGILFQFGYFTLNIGSPTA